MPQRIATLTELLAALMWGALGATRPLTGGVFTIETDDGETALVTDEVRGIASSRLGGIHEEEFPIDGVVALIRTHRYERTSESVPPRVESLVSAALTIMRYIARDVEAARGLDSRFGVDRYLREAIENRRAEFNSSQAIVTQFWSLATPKGIDAAAVIERLGGEPSLPSPVGVTV